MKIVWVCALLSALSVTACSQLPDVSGGTGHLSSEAPALQCVQAAPALLNAPVDTIARDASAGRLQHDSQSAPMTAPAATSSNENLPARIAEYVYFHKTWKQGISATTAVGASPSPTGSAQDGAAALERAAPPAFPETRSTAQPAANVTRTAANTPARSPSPATPETDTAPRAKTENVAPILVKPETPPPLDLKSLETRLRETSAIGVLTKLTLKNQVDDLLGQFRAYYEGRLKTTLAELRRPFELLLLKVLALLQDADPPLASAIVASREAIWDILSDPARFKAV